MKNTKKNKNNQSVPQPLKLRTPVVAVMGHVDHGKTTLIDAIRGSKIALGEVGGITQNTRANKVKVGDSYITLIDTPGHEAFKEMRLRGSRVADIALLVIAADDGVQPQTKESIQFIKAANIPVIVACNKIDAPGADVNKIKQELAQNDLLIEEYGGNAMFMEVSALKKQGITDLLEAIKLLAEVNELVITKPLQGIAEGFVLESNLNSDLGAVALVILKSGQIKRGDYIVSKSGVGKIRATLNELQQQTTTTEQGDPVWIIGIKEVLPAGEVLIFFSTEIEAKKLVGEIKASAQENPEPIAEALDDKELFESLVNTKDAREDVETTLKVIIKADAQGTLEAITTKLTEFSFPNARVEIFSAQTGDITESDVVLAKNIKGIVIGFQVRYGDKAQTIARREKVLVRNYKLIYELIAEVEAVVKSMLQPEQEIIEVARAKVKQVFTLTNGKIVAGCEVIKGVIVKGYKAYVERNGEEVGEGKIVSLKQLKLEIKEIKKGQDCGIILDPVIDLAINDEIVTFKLDK